MALACPPRSLGCSCFTIQVIVGPHASRQCVHARAEAHGACREAGQRRRRHIAGGGRRAQVSCCRATGYRVCIRRWPGHCDQSNCSVYCVAVSTYQCVPVSLCPCTCPLPMLLPLASELGLCFPPSRTVAASRRRAWQPWLRTWATIRMACPCWRPFIRLSHS